MSGFLTSFFLGLIGIPILRKLSFRFGMVVEPRADRWHRAPTPTMGGVVIYLSFLIGLLTYAWLEGAWGRVRWELLAASSVTFLLGFYDDLKHITPPAKLVGQIFAAAIAVFLGFTTNFFTPKIADNFFAQIPNIILTFIWLVGLTNAINLIDNMDGLAGGISLITAGFLIYFFWIGNDAGLLPIALALSGSILSFLVYNFPPAKVFMGDSGSLFLGFTLAVLAIARQPQASNVFAVMGVPTLLFLLPILDTSLVTMTRLLRGQSPSQGGRDHTSHRLVAFGLSERQTLFILFFIALLSGIVAIGIETVDYWLSLVLVPILVLSLSLLAAYLGRLKVVVTSGANRAGTFSRFIVEMTYKRRTLEIILDFFILGFAYYLAFWTSFGLALTDDALDQFLRTIPIAFGGTYLSFFISGIYRGVWRYVGVDDLLRFARAAATSVFVVALGNYFLDRSGSPSPVIYLLFGIYLFLGLAASRSSFKVLDQIYGHQSRQHDERVLILGASDAGEMAVRWILMNPQFGFRPIGFLDDDPFVLGREIHGLTILGGLDKLESLLEEKQVDGVVLTMDDRISGDRINQIVTLCQHHECWIRSLRLEFERLG
jgi:UDP-GlcNAc:undecaprenyl-phosphate GlcNAc-1-phosphate transferase